MAISLKSGVIIHLDEFEEYALTMSFFATHSDIYNQKNEWVESLTDAEKLAVLQRNIKEVE